VNQNAERLHARSLVELVRPIFGLPVFGLVYRQAGIVVHGKVLEDLFKGYGMRRGILLVLNDYLLLLFPHAAQMDAIW
jgi:hypothetical protein